MTNYIVYCAQCEQTISSNNSEKLQWLENQFCGVMCLKKYYLAQAVQCDECKSPLSAQNVEIVKSPADKRQMEYRKSGTTKCTDSTFNIHSMKNLVFCNEVCVRRYRSEHVLCCFCSAEVNITRSSKSQQVKTFCSPACEAFMNIHLGSKSVQQAKCSNCSQVKEVQMGIFIDGVKYITCSKVCHEEFKRNKDVQNEVCRQCLQPFEAVKCVGFVISEMDAESVFCSGTCMLFFILHNSKPVKCFACGNSGNYYRMIRCTSSQENRAWCSLYCLHKNRCSPNPKLMNGQMLNDRGRVDDKLVLMERFLMDCDENSNVPTSVTGALSLTRCKIKPLSKTDTEKLLAEREACQIRYCRGCNAKISTVKPFYRWHAIEFCCSFCIDHWLKTHFECRCWACETVITISNIYVHTEYVEAELRQFCSLECKSSYMEVVKLCGYCQTVLTQESEYDEDGSGFCTRLCEEGFVRVLSKDSNCTKKHCTDCDQLKPVKFNLFYNGKSYPFCSFACFFFVKFSCGIYADCCALCKDYFVQNSDENFTLYRGDKAIMICTKICRSHFIQIHQRMIPCSFCKDSFYDFHMLQFIDRRGSKVQYFCSKICYDLFAEMTPSGFVTEECNKKVHGIQDSMMNGECADIMPQEVSPDKKPDMVHLQGSTCRINMVTVATQTDESQIQCSCNKENVRRILIPTKRVAKNNGAHNTLDQIAIQPTKVARKEQAN